MKTNITQRLRRYRPVQSPLDEVGQIFRRLGGLSRLDVVFSMACIGAAAFWNCAMMRRAKSAPVIFKERVKLLTYQPSVVPVETQDAD